MAFARRLVATTDRVFSFVTADGPLAEVLRMRVAPLLIPTLASFEAAREYLFRTVSQITLNYRGSPLSAGEAGKVHGGDRLPWAPVNGHDNFSSLAAMDWQVHVYGSASEELIAACAAEALPAITGDDSGMSSTGRAPGKAISASCAEATRVRMEAPAGGRSGRCSAGRRARPGGSPRVDLGPVAA